MQRYDKMSQFLHDDDNDDAKAIAIPRDFSENSRAKNAQIIVKMTKVNTVGVKMHLNTNKTIKNYRNSFEDDKSKQSTC